MSWIGAALGAVTDVFSSLWQRDQNKQNLAAQARENQKNRDFNERMMQQANMWNLDMWNRQNEYNLPANQIMRLKQAGINPNLFYSNGSMSSAGSVAPSPSASSSGGISPVPPVSAKLDNMMALAQIENIKADTANKRTEGSILESDAKIRDDLNAGLLKTQNAEFYFKTSAGKLSEEQVKLVAPQIREFDARVSEIRATIDNLHSEGKFIDAQTVEQLIKNRRVDDLLTAQYDKYVQDTKESKARETLTYQEFRQSCLMLPLLLEQASATTENIRSDTSLKDAQAASEALNKVGIEIQNGILRCDLSRKQSYVDGMGLNSSNVLLSTLGRVLDAFTHFIPGGK